MKAVKYRLANNSKFAVKDRNRKLLDIIPSNTIFSALINNVNLIYGEEIAGKTVDLFINDEFSISSMFIGLDFYQLDSDELLRSIYFLPRPQALIEESFLGGDGEKEKQIINLKRAKSIRMISLAGLEKLGQGWDKDQGKFDFDLLDLQVLGSNLACTREELQGLELGKLEDMSFSKDRAQPHVQINRVSGDVDHFYYEEEKSLVYEYTPAYRIEPFMYFLYRGELNRELRAGINLIVDEGLGGKRSLGMGSFMSNEYIALAMEDREDASVFMTLSSYLPSRDEYREILGYELSRADGYIYYKGGLPFRKKSLGIIKEGGISTIRTRGRIVDVTPSGLELPNRIFFNGRSFSLGLGGGGYE